MQEVGEFAEKLNGPREEVYACSHVGVPQWKLQLTAQSLQTLGPREVKSSNQKAPL